MPDVISHFDSMLETLAEAVGMSHSFRPGASADEITRCQVECQWSFPDELVEFLGHTNGEEETNASVFLFASFCSLEQMKHAHEQLLGNEPNLINYTEAERVTINPCISTERRWQRHWIPIAYTDDCASILFLDTKPHKYLPQQVFLFTEETCCRWPIATSLTQLFEITTAYIREESKTPHVLDLPALDLSPYGWNEKQDP